MMQDVVAEMERAARVRWAAVDALERKFGLWTVEAARLASYRWMARNGWIGGADDGVRDQIVAENER
jgi:hypothetical protein